MHSFELFVLTTNAEDVSRLDELLARHDIVARLSYGRYPYELNEALQSQRWDALLIDQASINETLAQVRAQHPEIPVIVLANEMDENQAQELILKGASDSIGRDRLAHIVPILTRELRQARRRQDEERMAVRQAAQTIPERINAGFFGLDEDPLTAYFNQAAVRLLERRSSQEKESAPPPPASDAGPAPLAQERGRLLQMMWLILENMPAGCIVVDAELRITYWNAGAEHIFGFRRQEVLGRQTYECITPVEVRTLVDDMRQRMVNGERQTHSINYNHTKDGRKILCEWYNTPLLDDNGIFVGFLSMIEDITQRQQAAEEIRKLNEQLEQRVEERTAELLASYREMEIFTYSVSHDLKAPLRSMDGFSHILLDEYAASLDEQGRSYLHKIRAAVGQMHELIEDLLSYSQMERKRPSNVHCNPEKIIQTLLEERAEEIRARQVRVTINLNCAQVAADGEELTVVLRHLIDNALKFTRDAGAACLEIGGQEGTDTCTLWVRDNGIGFDMQYHDRIFTIFQRLNRAEDYPGTGIGLAIVYKIVQRSGGRVWAKSAPGRGATFYIELPVCAKV